MPTTSTHRHIRTIGSFLIPFSCSNQGSLTSHVFVLLQLFLLANIIMLSTDNVVVSDYQKVTEIQVSSNHLAKNKPGRDPIKTFQSRLWLYAGIDQ